jgi:hypothetical protein
MGLVGWLVGGGDGGGTYLKIVLSQLVVQVIDSELGATEFAAERAGWLDMRCCYSGVVVVAPYLEVSGERRYLEPERRFP